MKDDKIRQFAHDLANLSMMVVAFMDMIPWAVARTLPHYDSSRHSLNRMITLIREVQDEIHGRDDALLEGTSPELWQMIRDCSQSFTIPVFLEEEHCPRTCNLTQQRYLVDPKRLDRIVMNIVLNAKTAGATRLIIRPVCRADGLCDLAFLDNGQGMSQAELRRIGVPYTAEDGVVHGEGCRVIRTLCAEMGAVVYWESIVGLGTKVTIQWTQAGAPPGFTPPPALGR